MIYKDKHIPLYIQLKDLIIENIRSGKWEVNSQIPSEKELMKKYDIGRATVREAISVLANKGYIYKKKGIGTFVARNQPTIGFEPLMSFTTSLEVRGVKATNFIVDKKNIVIGDIEGDLSDLKWIKPDKCFYLKRIRSVNKKPLAIEESYFLDKINNFDEKYDLTGSLTKIMLEDLRVTIKKVEQVSIPRMPSNKEQKELKIDKNTLVLDIKRWIYIEGEENPFYYLKFIIIGDILNFS